MKILRHLLMISSIATAMSAGAAEAHPVRGGGGGYHGGYVSRPVYSRGYAAPRYHGGYSYARRPIYMRAPVIREHYYNYYRRPTLIVENYGPMDGYVWARGHWDWNGYEWIWIGGHYQPMY